ncbi:expressed protein [Batrachochytrium dendrobatidis JAM81]|uniref:Expressed protein n=1 Tax=Batrachochytrium dendrobatidis (strain JAM81 / FGSC 10211) TaxID=684364 RepID=F4P6I5_BATDJ|nr:uncharacterized protein BATDEDRAFT_35486 [Batrachochytrium dendrobatidis JAM81]EGF79611.1 expressed protein [Batrachochytrium dendrobatidis JAM81]|eukprot:XP_006680016.1 expressed protein [Batrachochytrium dendrobatidis JAM81]
MKLAVAVLSSILLACSVTTANPIDPSATTDVETSTSTVIPSATTSTESSTSSTPNPNGIGLDGLDPLPGNVKELLEKYAEIDHDRKQQRKICELLKSRYEGQRKVVKRLEKKLETLEKKPQRKGGDPEHDEKIQKAELDLEAQYFEFGKFRKEFVECESKLGDLVEKEWETDQQIVSLVFGATMNVATVAHQASLIKETPSAKNYLEKQSLKNKDLDQKSGGRRKHKDLESSDEESSDEESGSGSSRQKAPSNKRKGFSKLMDGLGSFFKRPKRDDPLN